MADEQTMLKRLGKVNNVASMGGSALLFGSTFADDDKTKAGLGIAGNAMNFVGAAGGAVANTATIMNKKASTDQRVGGGFGLLSSLAGGGKAALGLTSSIMNSKNPETKKTLGMASGILGIIGGGAGLVKGLIDGIGGLVHTRSLKKQLAALPEDDPKRAEIEEKLAKQKKRSLSGLKGIIGSGFGIAGGILGFLGAKNQNAAQSKLGTRLGTGAGMVTNALGLFGI